MASDDIKFDEPSYVVPRSAIKHNSFGDFLITLGVVKDKKHANIFLLGVIGVSAIIVLWLVLGKGPVGKVPTGPGVTHIPGEPPKLITPAQ